MYFNNKVLVFLILFFFPSFVFSESINVTITGFDDGIKTNKQTDHNEAVLFAKKQAIYKAGVSIKTMTTVKDYVVNSTYIETKSEAILEPGYQIVDVGYGEDGYYKVILIGKVKTKKEKYGYVILPVGFIYDSNPESIEMDDDKWQIDNMSLQNFKKINELYERNPNGKWTDIYWKVQVPIGKQKITCLGRSTKINVKNNSELKFTVFDFQHWQKD